MRLSSDLRYKKANNNLLIFYLQSYKYQYNSSCIWRNRQRFYNVSLLQVSNALSACRIEILFIYGTNTRLLPHVVLLPSCYYLATHNRSDTLDTCIYKQVSYNRVINIWHRFYCSLSWYYDLDIHTYEYQSSAYT